MSARAFVIASAVGIIIALALCIAMIATGQTFGQRCAEVYPRPSAAWERCVYRLSDGGPVYEENIAYLANPQDERGRE